MEKKNLEIAKTTQQYITKNKNIPATITVGKAKYNYGALNYIFAKTIKDNEWKMQAKLYGNAPAPTGQKYNGKINRQKYMSIIRTIINFYETKNRSPNYIMVGTTKVNPLVFVDVLSRILIFIKENKRYPETVTINTNILKTSNSTQVVSKDKVFNYFVETFGTVSTIDGALMKIKDTGYGHYFDNYLTNKQVIHNLKNGGQKPNCVDASQMIWHIAKALGYEVRALHVLCTGKGEGHIRLQLKHPKHTGGKWINRDPACVVIDNGKSVSAIWCGSGKLIATNPAWFMESLNL